MQVKRKCKVVMLPTNEKSGDFSKERNYPCILKYSWMFDKKETGKLIYSDSNIRTPTQLQHLYILSDEEIKEGDWITDGNKIYKAPNTDGFIGLYKIIATTEIKVGTSEYSDRYRESYFNPLPQPSPQFIAKYIEEYNKGNRIEEVMVEYTGDYDDYYKGWYEDTIQLKVDKQNCITITKIKDSWNKKEVITFIFKAYNLRTMDKERRSIKELNDWIEQNL